MQCWNMCNDILHKILHQHVIIVDMLFLQQNPHNELEANTDMDMNMNMNLHPAQNDEVHEIHRKNEQKRRETVSNPVQNDDTHEVQRKNDYKGRDKEEWISSGKFCTKVMKKKDNGKPVTKKKENMHTVLEDYDELLEMIQLKEDNCADVSSCIKLH